MTCPERMIVETDAARVRGEVMPRRKERDHVS